MASHLLVHLHAILHDLKGRLDEDLHARLQARSARIQRADEYAAVGEAIHVLLDSYREAGYTHVRVQTAGDDQVCFCCRERRGRVYPADSARRVCWPRFASTSAAGASTCR